MNMVEGLELLTGKAPKPHEGRAMALEDGSRVAVIGAGPAGSMFSYFFLSMAETIGLDVKVDIFEPRSFCHRGPAGCNHCGGIVSESLVQRLATEGIRLPDCVVQRGIESYTLHMDVGDVEIATPLMEKRIAAIYRGNGPRSSEPLDTQSFDGYLLDLAKQKGARVIPRLVTGLRREKDSMTVQCADQSSDSYELAVVATGVNSRLTEMLENESGEFARPDRTKTFICEFHLGRKLIRETFGPSMHVFLLDIPRLEFAALIPKGDYVTWCYPRTRLPLLSPHQHPRGNACLWRSPGSYWRQRNYTPVQGRHWRGLSDVQSRCQDGGIPRRKRRRLQELLRATLPKDQ
jgi:2-polyprenyl-6-methoxyphenol hydroxylase-like FAD-dependent oxidoreductase